MTSKKQGFMMVSRRDFLKYTALATAPAAMWWVSGCAPTAVPAGTQPAAGESAAAPAAGAVQPMIVAPVYGTEPDTMDPHYGESAIGMTVLNNVLETLVNYDRDMNIVPVLAESYEVKEDLVTWVFKLREGITFHNGEPFNAAAVKFTVDRTMNDDLRGQGLNDPFPDRSGVVAVNVIDDYTVEMVLAAPNVVLPVFLTFLYILEPTHYSQPIEVTSIQPVGTGPYRITEWVKGDHITFEAFEDYWRGTPGIQEFQFKPIPEIATRLNMLLAGEADIIGGLTAADFAQVEGNPNLRISQAPGSRRAHIGIPSNVERYQDRRVRMALVQAIDVEGIGAALFGGMAPERISNVLVSGEGWRNPDLEPVAYDPEAARAALEEAGFDFSQPITVYASGGGLTPEVAKAVAGNLRDVGLQAEAQMLDWVVFTDKMRSETGMDDLYYLTLGSRANGPEDVSIVTTGQIWDQTQWSTNTENGPLFNEMYQELAQTFDEAKQHELVNELQRLFYDEHVWAHLWIEPVASGVSNRVTWDDSGGGNRLQFWLYGEGEEPDRLTE